MEEIGYYMVDVRKDKLVAGQAYHIFNKSIAGFKIFNSDSEFKRMMAVICFYQRENPSLKFSRFTELKKIEKEHLQSGEKLVEIIAYCLMPTHAHLILKQLKDNGISIFMSNIQNSYARYFNIKLDRKGPLWVGKFKNVLVETDEQLLHLTRYIHLNPTTAGLVNKPEEWGMSSYQEYLLKRTDGLCKYNDILDIEPVSYSRFVEHRISYQRDLEKIKHLILE